MELAREILIVLYFAIFLILAVFGLHRYFLVIVYYRSRRSASPRRRWIPCRR